MAAATPPSSVRTKTAARTALAPAAASTARRSRLMGCSSPSPSPQTGPIILRVVDGSALRVPVLVTPTPQPRTTVTTSAPVKATYRIIDAYDHPHGGRILRLRLGRGEALTVKELKGGTMVATSPEGAETRIRVEGFRALRWQARQRETGPNGTGRHPRAGRSRGGDGPGLDGGRPRVAVRGRTSPDCARQLPPRTPGGSRSNALRNHAMKASRASGFSSIQLLRASTNSSGRAVRM